MFLRNGEDYILNEIINCKEYINELNNLIKNKKFIIISTTINSGDFVVANDLVKNINDSNFLIIQLNHFKKLNFGRDKILIFLDNSICKQIDIKTINLTKVAWVRNWERLWLPYLKDFDYVLCCNNKAKIFFENNKIKSYILPIGANFEELDFNKKPTYDIFVDCNLFNRINNVEIVLRLKK